MDTVARFKKHAKTLQKKKAIKLHEAQRLVARKQGFEDWRALIGHYDRTAVGQVPIPLPDKSYLEEEDVIMTKPEIEITGERSADLTDVEKQVIHSNRKVLIAHGLDFAVLEPTSTGLKKSILDATQPIRELFKDAGFHDYALQQQGGEHKVIKDALLISEEGVKNARVSLYRPNTKQGDPRMWITELRAYVEAGAQLALHINDDKLLVMNLSVSGLSDDESFTNQYIKGLSDLENTLASELLEKLKKLAKNGPVEAITHGSTAIGMSVEHALGIPANSSKTPDYEGVIELKSGRGVKNRTTLFAQVADWGKSPCTSSAQILDKYGYYREGDLKLYCSVSTKKANSQRLFFEYDEKDDVLYEMHTEDDVVALWLGSKLRERLLEKHKETFWIQADSIMKGGKEYFQLRSVVHTRNPLRHQLMPLIRDGYITMDHLIKRRSDTQRVSEKGPLFKINKKDLGLLFPEPITYNLLD